MYFKSFICVSIVAIAIEITIVQGSCLEYGHSCWGAHGKRSAATVESTFKLAPMIEIHDRASTSSLSKGFRAADTQKNRENFEMYPEEKRLQLIANKFKAQFHNRLQKTAFRQHFNELSAQRPDDKHKRAAATRYPFEMLKLYRLAYKMPRRNFHYKGINNMDYTDLN